MRSRSPPAWDFLHLFNQTYRYRNTIKKKKKKKEMSSSSAFDDDDDNRIGPDHFKRPANKRKKKPFGINKTFKFFIGHFGLIENGILKWVKNEGVISTRWIVSMLQTYLCMQWENGFVKGLCFNQNTMFISKIYSNHTRFQFCRNISLETVNIFGLMWEVHIETNEVIWWLYSLP